MTTEERVQDKLKKGQEVERLENLLSPIAKSAINDLTILYSVKKEQEEALNKRIRENLNQLRYQVLMFFWSKINSFSEDDLRKVCGIYFIKDKKVMELLPFIIETSFHINMDVDGNLYALTGTGFTPPIKMEDMVRREIAKTHEGVKELLERVNSYLEGIAKFYHQPIDDTENEFRISYNIAGLTHENPQSLKD